MTRPASPDDDLDDEPTDDGSAAFTAGPIELTDGHGRSHLRVLSFSPSGAPALLEHSFVVEEECHGWRLDRFLMKKMRRLSRTRVQRVIRGDLDVDGHPVRRPAMTVRRGQVVRFRRAAPVEPAVARQLSVLCTDPLFFALDKPAGLPMHPTARYHYGTLTALLRECFPSERLQLCHRLDRETSGIVLAARTSDSGSALKRAFARRLVRKRYLAVTYGHLRGEHLVDAPLALAGERVRVRMAVRTLALGGLPARTLIRPLAHYEGFTLVEACPETGRQHQIRVHLAHLGHPIVGDKLYPDDAPFVEWVDHGSSPALEARLLLPRHALHAAALTFPHPGRDEAVTTTSPLPADLVGFLSRLTPR